MSTPSPIQVTIPIGANPITIQTGKLAKLADGAVTVSYAETTVLVTVVSSTKIKDGQDFFPLTVEYREKAAAVGRFPGGYFKREGRPSEKEILTCRMTDRPLRPLFPKGYLYDTQIITTLLSADGENDADILSINGASAALMISDIPFQGPIGAIRLGRINGQYIVNPSHEQRSQSDLDLVYVGTEHHVLMIEGSAKELPDEAFASALAYAQTQILPLIQAQKQLAATAGKPKRNLPLFTVPQNLLDTAYQVAGDRIEAAIYQPQKIDRQNAIAALKDEVKQAILAQFPNATEFEISSAFDYLQMKAFRRSILDLNKRCDGRLVNQIRPLHAECGLFPRPHGSALFSRGETQAICMATLGSLDEAQEIDAYTGGEKIKRFILHYHFPPFSVGETGRVGGLNRREIGHGALAERSLLPVIPPQDKFPYAIRITSEILESNGSTSMATVCGGSLALMDAGVPITAPVAGISVGLVTEFNQSGQLTRYLLLDDIIGSEDHFGDMDFKLCGTHKGVTGFQLDLKLPGIPVPILQEATHRAHASRIKILAYMETILSKPKPTLSPYAPRIETIKIDPEKIGLLIGPGGKTIKGIIAETGAEISVEDDGTVRIYSNNGSSLNQAVSIIEDLCGEVVVGKLYRGKVTGIKEFGAFVEVKSGRDGLIHISELSESRVEKVEDVLKVGDETWVKCIGIDERGKIKLSRKAALKEIAQQRKP